MRLLVLGPPGAGKGTQAVRLARHLGVPHIATGDIFREAASQPGDFGSRVREIMERGELISDELTNELVRERLSDPDASSGFILDGYPRTAEQARALDDILDLMGTKLDLAVKFMVRRSDIVARLNGRRVCPGCGAVYHMAANPPKRDEVCDHCGTALVQRGDDAQEQALIKRLDVYGAQTRPLYQFYGDRGILVEMDALGSTGEVFERLLAVVGR
ncbi:MAG: adenylate kinase [Actinomycetota bacterium]